MKRSMLIFGLFLTVYGFAFGAVAVMAQSFPNRPIQLIVPIPPGGGGDVNARILLDELGKNLGTQVIVVNKPGAMDTLGTAATAISKKDGYTLGYSSAAAMVYTRVMNSENVHYDPVADFDHLGLHSFFPLCLAVQESSPWKTFGDLLDYAKKNPGKIRVSIAGLGGASHLNLEMIHTLTGAQFTYIPYKGGEAVITSLLGGHVEASFDAIGKFSPHVDAGKLRVLLISKKYSMYPNIPTITELGFKQDLFSGWFGFVAPVGIPEEAKKALIPAIEKAVKNPGLKAKVEEKGYVVEYRSPAEFKKLIVSDYEAAHTLAVKLGLSKP
jgi:tripartite-type tricarboxylate transporter receptor subunit TctC